MNFEGGQVMVCTNNAKRDTENIFMNHCAYVFLLSMFIYSYYTF